jgi:hypothetical protein
VLHGVISYVQLAEQGLLPEGKADPLALAEELSAMALAANDDAGIAAAQSPWTVAGGVEAALKVIEDALRARPDMRVTGAGMVQYCQV